MQQQDHVLGVPMQPVVHHANARAAHAPVANDLHLWAPMQAEAQQPLILEPEANDDDDDGPVGNEAMDDGIELNPRSTTLQDMLHIACRCGKARMPIFTVPIDCSW